MTGKVNLVRKLYQRETGININSEVEYLMEVMNENNVDHEIIFDYIEWLENEKRGD